MTVNIVIPEKNDPIEQFEQPIDVGSDGLAAAGFYPQLSGTVEPNIDVGIERDVDGNLIFKDINNMIKLSDITWINKIILNTDGSLVYIEDGDIVLKED